MKKLLCISNSYAATFLWATRMRLDRNDVVHFSPYMNADKARGLGEPAIVWVAGDSNLELSDKHRRVLEVYIGLGAPQFFGFEVDLIEMWMFGVGWVERRAQREALAKLRAP